MSDSTDSEPVHCCHSYYVTAKQITSSGNETKCTPVDPTQ